MYFRQILRTRFVRTAHLNQLHRVCRAEVAALNFYSLVFFLINISFSIAAAEYVDNNFPTSPVGGCGKPTEPHHQEVWFIVSFISCFDVFCTHVLNMQKAFIALCVMCLSDGQRPLCTKSDEVKLAEEASKKYGSPAPTIFSKVIDKSIPADIIYEDDKVNSQHLQNKWRLSHPVYSTWSQEID